MLTTRLLPIVEQLPIQPKAKRPKSKKRPKPQEQELSVLDTLIPYLYPEETLDEVVSSIKTEDTTRNFILWQYDREVEQLQDAIEKDFRKVLSEYSMSNLLLLEVLEWCFDSAFHGKGNEDDFTYFAIMREKGFSDKDSVEFLGDALEEALFQTPKSNKKSLVKRRQLLTGALKLHFGY